MLSPKTKRFFFSQVYPLNTDGDKNWQKNGREEMADSHSDIIYALCNIVIYYTVYICMGSNLTILCVIYTIPNIL